MGTGRVAPVRRRSARTPARVTPAQPDRPQHEGEHGGQRLARAGDGLVLRTKRTEWMRVNPRSRTRPIRMASPSGSSSHGNRSRTYRFIPREHLRAVPAGEVNKEIKPPGSGTIGDRRTAVSSLLSPPQNNSNPPYSAPSRGERGRRGYFGVSFPAERCRPAPRLAYHVGAAIAPDYDWYRTLVGEEAVRL